jgi:hypothetical protein
MEWLLPLSAQVGGQSSLPAAQAPQPQATISNLLDRSLKNSHFLSSDRISPSWPTLYFGLSRDYAGFFSVDYVPCACWQDMHVFYTARCPSFGDSERLCVRVRRDRWIAGAFTVLKVCAMDLHETVRNYMELAYGLSASYRNY